MDALLAALVEVAQPLHLLMLMGGVVAGLIVGVIPGIGGLFGMALLIPLTYSLDPYAAFALLLGMGSVTTTSDTIPAILFGVPGTVGAAATVLDGHAMAKNGEAARAFGAAYSASLIGGVFGAIVLAAAIPVMRPLVLFLRTPDFFAICAFGLSIVAHACRQPAAQGIGRGDARHAGLPSSASTYRRGRSLDLRPDLSLGGLPIVVVFLGLFGLPELASLLLRGSIQEQCRSPTYSGMRRGMRDTLREWPLVLRCSPIGSLLGAVPGIGIAVVDWIAYGHAARRPGPGRNLVRAMCAGSSRRKAPTMPRRAVR